jgi:hypothetical protein
LTYVVLQIWSLRTTPVAGLILLPPGVQFKAVKGDALAADAHLAEIRADLGIEKIAVRAEIAGCISETKHPRHDIRAATAVDSM